MDSYTWSEGCAYRRYDRISCNILLVLTESIFHLNRWRIVIHGGIDGFSRIPLYLKTSNNNKASRVLSCFREAVSEYGLPSRIRPDKGGETVYANSHPARPRQRKYDHRYTVQHTFISFTRCSGI